MSDRPATPLKTTYPGANPFEIKGSKEAVLLLHGFTGTPGEMRPIADAIHDAFGYTCVAPLLPGHGTTIEDLDTTTFLNWQQAARDSYEKLSKSYQKVHVAGLSAGALLCMDLLLRYPDIASAVLLAPAISLRGISKKVMRLLLCVPLPPLFFPISKPPAQIQEHIAYRAYPLRSLKQFGLLQSLTKRSLRNIPTPTLTIYSTADKTIDDRGIEETLHYFQHVKSKSVRLTRAEHILPLSCEKKEILREVVDFHRSLK